MQTGASAEARNSPILAAGVSARSVRHYRLPHERPFTAPERCSTSILVGGLTRRHDRFVRAVFEGCGYRCLNLPVPDREAYLLGREFCNNGQCCPAYFTAGSLIQFLRGLERRGLSRREIVDRFVFFTAGSCGPCRFGMYESEYRLALHNAGYDGFRVLLFQQDHGVLQGYEEPGLRYSLDFGFGMYLALLLGDLLNDLAQQIRPFEVRPGETDRVMEECTADVCELLHNRTPFDIDRHVPARAGEWLRRHQGIRHPLIFLGRYRHRLHGRELRETLARCRQRLDRIEIDRTRVKPVVKVIGEFWVQTTEGDGNYRMFQFLEHEGAQVHSDPISMWATYLLNHARLGLERRSGLSRRRWRQSLSHEFGLTWKRVLLRLGESFYVRHYERLAAELGGLAHPLPDQSTLARLAQPYYNPLLRGGEGHLEVAKNIYYSSRGLCHMVLSLKPFGCMPSSQSDGAQSAVVSRFREMTFVPIEISGEGEVHAQSRAQMALWEAKAKARREFDFALASTGRRLEEVRHFVSLRPELRRPSCRVPRRPGVAGTAANYVLYVHELMKRDAGSAGENGNGSGASPGV